MPIQMIDEKQIIERIKARKNPFFNQYYALYSSWFGGIVTDPHLMLLPLDDHMVHRSDGVFEAMKAVGRAVYLLDEHLQRLSKSAQLIALDVPDLDHISDVIRQTLQAANKDHATIRVYLSRGPGNFTVNPYDSIGAQLYVVITELKEPPMAHYEHGVSIGLSQIPVKSSWMARIKSCNYLPNVLMKKEAVDRKLDYVIGINEQGHITESATENIMIVDENGVLSHPILESILEGTTMMRACELAREQGVATCARKISMDDLKSAREVMITGTTLNVLPVVQLEDSSVGNGKPGLIAKRLNTWMIDDIKKGERSLSF